MKQVDKELFFRSEGIAPIEDCRVHVRLGEDNAESTETEISIDNKSCKEMHFNIFICGKEERQTLFNALYDILEVFKADGYKPTPVKEVKTDA